MDNHAVLFLLFYFVFFFFFFFFLIPLLTRYNGSIGGKENENWDLRPFCKKARLLRAVHHTSMTIEKKGALDILNYGKAAHGGEREEKKKRIHCKREIKQRK